MRSSVWRVQSESGEPWLDNRQCMCNSIRLIQLLNLQSDHLTTIHRTLLDDHLISFADILL